MSDGFQSGDRVLDLRAVARSGGMFAGLVVAPVAAGLSGWVWWWCLLAAVASALGGFLVGGVVGRIVFPAPPGQTVITKVGAAALGLALRASLAGGLIVCAAGALAAFAGAGGVEAVITLFAGLGVSAGAGCLSALL